MSAHAEIPLSRGVVALGVGARAESRTQMGKLRRFVPYPLGDPSVPSDYQKGARKCT